MNLDRRLLRQAGLVKAALAGAIIAGFLAGLATMFQARQISRITSAVFLEGAGRAEVMPAMGLLLAAVAGRAVLTYFGELASGAAARGVKLHLRDQLTRHLLLMGPAYTQGERSGELANTLSEGVEALDAYFSQYLPQLMLAGMIPIAYLAVIFPLDPLSAVVLLLTGPLIPFFMFLIGSTAQKLTRRQWTALSRMSAYFLDTLQGLVTLKALGRSREQGERIARVSDQYRDTTLSVLRITFLSALVLELLGTIGTAIIAVEIGLRLLYGRMGFEGAFFVLLLAPDFYLPLRTLGLRFHASMSGVSAARRIFEVLQVPLPPVTTPTGSPAGEAVPAQALSPETIEFPRDLLIELEAVDYTYPGRDQPALRGVSLRIQAGQTVALVGASGAGKSTIANLLLGFAAPDCGAIRISGKPLAEIPIEQWRSWIAWSPQQPYLFNGSIADNLLLAKPGASEAELCQALRQAHLLEWTTGLPEGIHTKVGEGAARLSGGQAQRLALARAFLRDAPLLILDEPTAHLDVVQERLLQETTRELCAGRTVLVIAHRLSTATRADAIVVLEKGRVIEQGAHHDLLASGGAYAHLLAANRGAGVC